MTVRGTDIRQTRYVRVDPGSSTTVLFQARLTGDGTAVITVDGRRATVRLHRSPDAVPAPANLTVTRFAGSVVALSWRSGARRVVPGVPANRRRRLRSTARGRSGRNDHLRGQPR